MDQLFNTARRVNTQVTQDLIKAGVKLDSVTTQLSISRPEGVSAYVWLNDDIVAAECHVVVTSAQAMRKALTAGLLNDLESRKCK